MTEHTNLEPLWVGMDVDAELARYAEEDRRSEQAESLAAPSPQRSPRRRGLRAALPSLRSGAVPQSPLAA
jgi:hypothetical protein